MINQTIAQHLKESLQPLADSGLISRLAGLVKVLETDRFSGTKKKKFRFPIPVEENEEGSWTLRRTYPDLVPDSCEHLIAYFEDFGSTCVDGKSKWQSRIRLVAWANMDRLQPSTLKRTDIPALLTAMLTKHLLKAEGDSLIGSLRVSVTSSPEAGANLFTRYTYNETSSQYLMPPYFALGLDLTITYNIAYGCSIDLVAA